MGRLRIMEKLLMYFKEMIAMEDCRYPKSLVPPFRFGEMECKITGVSKGIEYTFASSRACQIFEALCCSV